MFGLKVYRKFLITIGRLNPQQIPCQKNLDFFYACPGPPSLIYFMLDSVKEANCVEMEGTCLPRAIELPELWQEATRPSLAAGPEELRRLAEVPAEAHHNLDLDPPLKHPPGAGMLEEGPGLDRIL